MLLVECLSVARWAGRRPRRGDDCLEVVLAVAADVLKNRHGGCFDCKAAVRTGKPEREIDVSNETNAMLALKNAWSGAIAASDRLRELGPAVQGLPEDADVTQLDLDTYLDAALAQSIAALALRGLIEEFQPKVAAPPQE
jgi:hypothetical protein